MMEPIPPNDASRRHAVGLPKVATRIDGLDDILHGGIPVGGTTLVWGGAGCGKSILGLEFLYRGALAGEPGILVVFEERPEAVRQHALTLGWDLTALERAGKLFLLEGAVDPAAILAGDFDLQGLLSIIGARAESLGAKRIVIDAVDALTRLYRDPWREQSEIYTLQRFLSSHGMTTILTMKVLQYQNPLPGYEFLDFMADCVIKLDQRSNNQINTRRLQVIKYRGSSFGRNEYPYIIAEDGIHLLPISSMVLTRQAREDVISSGSAQLDTMLGSGYKRGSSLLIPGAPGTGKTTVASTFAQAGYARGEKTLFLAFEESEEAVVTNMLSPGIDLRPALQAGTLCFLTAMPEAMGAEEHLFIALREIAAFQPRLVIVDALSSLLRMGTEQAAFDYAIRLLLACKQRGITCLFTNQLFSAEEETAFAGNGISSLVDTVILLRFTERSGMLHRTLLVRKVRGAAHSVQCHEFCITDRGLEVLGVYTGDRGIRTGRRVTPGKGSL
jgi:circadian clock protein KaiC